MGYHSLGYYNNKMFKGNTDKTGFAWWYDQARENPLRPSHYPNFIPIEVMRSVLGWDAQESVSLMAVFELPAIDENGLPALDEQGLPIINRYELPVTDHKALGRSDWIVNGVPEGEEEDANPILSVVTTEYGVHSVKDVFFSNVEDLVGGEENVGIESFGELKWGKRLFASFSIPEHIENPDSGLQFRPILTVVTSYDRTLATQYLRTFGIPVCDNTLNYELTKVDGRGGAFKLRHSKNSATRLGDARQALGLLNEQTEDMQRWTSEMMGTEVPEDKFIDWLQVMIPMPEISRTTITIKSIQGEDMQVEKVSARAQSIAQNKRDKLLEMWDFDERVSGPVSEGRPWKNTKLGVFQLWNTFQQHESRLMGVKAYNGDRAMARANMNMDKLINGTFANDDMRALATLDRILSGEDDPVMVSVPVGAPQFSDEDADILG